MGFRELKHCNTALESTVASEGIPRDTIANTLESTNSVKTCSFGEGSIGCEVAVGMCCADISVIQYERVGSWKLRTHHADIWDNGISVG